jgi:hypothetical protein
MFWSNCLTVGDFAGMFNKTMKMALAAITAKTAYNTWRFVSMVSHLS